MCSHRLLPGLNHILWAPPRRCSLWWTLSCKLGLNWGRCCLWQLGGNCIRGLLHTMVPGRSTRIRHPGSLGLFREFRVRTGRNRHIGRAHQPGTLGLLGLLLFMTRRSRCILLWGGHCIGRDGHLGSPGFFW